MPNSHPSQALLMDYAAGSLNEAAALLISTHIPLCPACRRQAQGLEAIGGLMLDAITPAPVAPVDIEAVLRRLDRPHADSRAAEGVPCDTETARLLPAALRRRLGTSLKDIKWKSRGMVDQFDLPLSNTRGAAQLLRLRPGQKVSRHTHDGIEMTIVLSGGYRDEAGHYMRGDMAVAGPDVEHAPIADADGYCICLVVVDGSIKLTGPLGRIVNLLLRN